MLTTHCVHAECCIGPIFACGLVVLVRFCPHTHVCWKLTTKKNAIILDFSSWWGGRCHTFSYSSYCFVVFFFPFFIFLSLVATSPFFSRCHSQNVHNNSSSSSSSSSSSCGVVLLLVERWGRESGGCIHPHTLPPQIHTRAAFLHPPITRHPSSAAAQSQCCELTGSAPRTPAHTRTPSTTRTSAPAAPPHSPCSAT